MNLDQYFKFTEESDDWSKLVKLISPGNLAKLGNPRLSIIADCLGDNISNRYQVGQENNVYH